MEKYDVIVIGAGAAGLGCSGVANTMGLNTLLVEQDENNFGGDCTNYGCVPSKALIHIAAMVHQAKKAERFGIKTSGSVDMEKVLAYIHEKQKIIRDSEDAEALRKHGIDVVIGRAKFASKNKITANGKEYTAKLIFLCTGSKPRTLAIPGSETVPVYTNENIFFECRTLPKNLVVIGGGHIGCELGQAFSRLGSNVTLINRGSRIMGKEPKNVSEILESQFAKEGITIHNNTILKEIKDGKAILTSKSNRDLGVACDALLMAVGRMVRTEGMDLEKGGIALDEKGKIAVNPYLQSTNKRVYVLGDAAGSYQFSHGAEKMVKQVWRNILMPLFKKKNTLDDLSWVTFTEPQVAHFGLTENQLYEEGIKYYRQDQDMGHEDRAILQEYQYGHLAVYYDGHPTVGKKRILSGSMIAPQAGELIQELQLAKHAKIPVKTFNDRLYPYPVAARINQKNSRGLMAASYTPMKLKLARRLFHLFH